MAYAERFENNEQDNESAASETLREAYLDLCRGIGASATGLLMDSLAGMASVSKASKEAQSLEIALKIKELGDDRFPVRERASAALEKLGAAALPALVKAQKDPDLEVSRRADRLVGRLISGDLPDLESRVGGLTFSLLDTRTDPEIRKDFQDVVGTIDRLLAEPSKVKERLAELAAVRQHVQLSDLQKLAVDRQERELISVGRMSAGAREHYAAYLIGSGCPAEANAVLRVAMSKHPEVTGQRRFMKLALAAGADQDKEFLQAFAKHGGNADELQKIKNEKTVVQELMQGASDKLQVGVDKLKMGADELKQEFNRLFKKKLEQ
jgi:hypothetical protein